MAGFSWMSGTLALLLFAGHCFAAVDKNHLADLVNEISFDKKDVEGMFGVAASIPEKKDTDQRYDTSQVFTDENLKNVKTTINNGGVYTEGRIVAAKFLKKKGKKTKYFHAEYRVLENFGTLVNKNYDKDHDLLLFYVRGSPCYHQCTNEGDQKNILQYLHQIKKWTHYAFVFTDVYQSQNPAKATTEDQRKEALKKLGGESDFGLENIFRCAESDGPMKLF